MNSFGRIFKVSIYGESHGPVVGIVVDGIPPGIELSTTDFHSDIARRKPGSKGTTTRVEADEPVIKSGVFNQKTTGAPLCIEFINSNIRSGDYDQFVNQPRPGHSDFSASRKFKNFNDHRGGGHFSGRLTAAIVAAGVVAKKILTNIQIQARIVEAGGKENIEEALQLALESNDSIGGIVECRVTGIPVGWGEPFFDSLESVLAHLMFAIPAVKGIEFGSGFQAAKMKGSTHNDPIIDQEGHTLTNHSGGISGGLGNGNEMVFRIAVKPTSSTPQKQQTYDFEKTTVSELVVEGRHDLCIALRVPVVVEAMTALGLVDLMFIQSLRG